MNLAVKSLSIEDDDLIEWNRIVAENDWGDGLPTVPPTVKRVNAFLASIKNLSADVSPIPPRGITPSLEVLAANAVMAGCRPEHFRAAIAALRASLNESFNLHGVLATTHPATPMVFFNGPVRKELGINGGTNCLGQGVEANAVIGRALHLFHTNIGGATPGKLDKATHGTPGKYSYCFAENEEESPWDPYHVRQGFEKEQSVATVVAAEAPHNVNDHGSTSAQEIATTIAGTMSQTGSNAVYLHAGPHFLIMGPEHARTIVDDGWSLADLQAALFERSRVHESRITAGNIATFDHKGKKPINGYYYLGTSPDQIEIVVAGGPGKHSMWIPTFGSTVASSAVVD